MWKYCENKTNDLSFHDCVVTRLFIDSDDLIMEFNDGFWVVGNTQHNTNNETYRSDSSQLKLINYDVANIYVYNKTRLFTRLINTRRISLELEILIANVNSGKWELEFLSEYRTYRGVFFTCLILSKKRPYMRECQLFLDHDEMKCYWNNLCLDKPW